MKNDGLAPVPNTSMASQMSAERHATQTRVHVFGTDATFEKCTRCGPDASRNGISTFGLSAAMVAEYVSLTSVRDSTASASTVQRGSDRLSGT
jgi:hypothetical protein